MQYGSGTIPFSPITPPLTNIFCRLSADLDQLQHLLMQSPPDLGFRAAESKHLCVIEIVRQLFINNDPVYELFMAYPTQRLMRLLYEATSEAKSAVRWLASNPPVITAAEGLNFEYATCCNELQSGVREWYVFVKIKMLLGNLDDVAPETVH
jgi:hypothetical protein